MELSLKIYEHAAALISRTPWQVSRDAELLYTAHAAAYRLYRHTPLIPAIDHYNLEPEAYGARVAQPGGLGVPAIVEPKVKSVADLLRIRPFDPHRDGRIPMVMEVARRLAHDFPDAKVSVPVSGPFSIAGALVGFAALLGEVAENPELVAAVLMHLVGGQVSLVNEIKTLGLDVAFAESAAGPPLLSPPTFRGLELPALKALLARLGQILGHPVACLMGGDTVRILDSLLETGSSCLVCPYETDQAAFVERLRDRADIRLRVNLNSGIVARGRWEELRAEADRILGFVRDRPNTILGTGVLPYETQPENILRLQQYLAPL